MDQLKKNITYDVQCYVIKVDGKVHAVLKDKKEAEDVLNAVKNTYIKEGTEIAETSFVEEVAIEPQFIESLDMVLTKKSNFGFNQKHRAAKDLYDTRRGYPVVYFWQI